MQGYTQTCQLQYYLAASDGLPTSTKRCLAGIAPAARPCFAYLISGLCMTVQWCSGLPKPSRMLEDNAAAATLAAAWLTIQTIAVYRGSPSGTSHATFPSLC
jgi:hypothetical protein